jgi:hypothetical protein
VAEGPLRNEEGPWPPGHAMSGSPAQLSPLHLLPSLGRGRGAGSWVVPKWSVKIERYIFLCSGQSGVALTPLSGSRHLAVLWAPRLLPGAGPAVLGAWGAVSPVS